MSEVLSSFKSLRAGSQVFALLMLSLCVNLHTIYLALRYVLIVCHQYDVCKNYVGSVYVGGYVGLREFCPVSFLVVRESLSVLL